MIMTEAEMDEQLDAIEDLWAEAERAECEDMERREEIEKVRAEIRADIAKECKYLLDCGMGKKKALNHLIKILGAEETEECPFEKDELVEVSYDNEDWCLRYFSQISDGVYYVFAGGQKSTDTDRVISWKYCRKYGTLGKEHK